MLSTAQLAANTANAQLSTGPRTTEGKAISSQNARTHGLTSRDCIVAPEDQPVFQDLLTSLTAEHKPEGATEHLLFYQLVQASWNLRRINRLETSLATTDSDPLLDDSLDRTMARLSRYHNRCERTLFRSIKQLKQLQTDRAVRDALLDAQAVVPLLVSITDLTKRTRPKDHPGRPETIQFALPARRTAPRRPENRRRRPARHPARSLRDSAKNK